LWGSHIRGSEHTVLVTPEIARGLITGVVAAPWVCRVLNPR
jgi:hypothetical protein